MGVLLPVALMMRLHFYCSFQLKICNYFIIDIFLSGLSQELQS
jgi:hypothetical protein